MLEKILLIITALAVIFIAELLVKRQNKCHKISEELSKEIKDEMNAIFDDYDNLIGEESIERSLTHLENNITKLNDRLSQIENKMPKHLERREKKCRISKKRWK